MVDVTHLVWRETEKIVGTKVKEQENTYCVSL